MLCPIDQTELVISVRQEVEIDYCPTCRGVWLDRGELDKIIDRVALTSPAAAAANAASSSAPLPDATRSTAFDRESDRSYRRDDDDDDDDRNIRNQGFGRKKKKRESFLSDLFDF